MKRSKGFGLDFGALRLCIERCGPDPMLGFYADDVELSIVAANVPQTSFFNLGGESEVAKHPRAVYDQRASHRVERVVVDEGVGEVLGGLRLPGRQPRAGRNDL